jgi:protein-tyrosine phosphatase
LIRSLARTLRHAPDRLRHSTRHEVARKALTGRRKTDVLFVCHGNICRSPYAEHALVRDLGDREGWRIVSAGFVKPDRPSPAEARAVASRRGVDLEEHRSRLLTDESVETADLIYVMSAAQERDIQEQFGADPGKVWVLGDLDPEPIRKRTIRDPVEQPEAVFEEVYDRIDRCIRVMVESAGPPAA